MELTALSAFRAGAWAWVLTGAGHLTLAAVLALRPADPATAPAVAAMRDADFGFAGPGRSLYDLNAGMSLVMGVALIFAGLVCVLVARGAPALVGRSRSLSGPALVASMVAFGLSVWLLPLPPIVLFGVATAAFGWAVRRAS
ncbi:hypothetical protein GCM10010168_19530 [Actinoplanes ianthinogenes]|uniref:Integral membrane protein n=1 Tax=Actinoplanes ianthinogenes TaxID=122358 RepID=A0ABN6CQV0_9ACTN|nr:hypothetical protein [Actinoplanes ianthinogenes]BCJ47595.1 hypothetical protein Aiant_82520 [Actinoplanes ianthinogenes]GGR02827.1 hypothetical protein GCM10010168_19530 [Actinoplanes ianthinogenes]